ncbi:hypothetical protein ACODT5_38755 [Streptomyces sp. 5.8]|uniref:hypothetical protein n=1 Tax=Streptomyces sp. 5.8 TaxID=3406571 RepID=UPI003BB4A663
MNEYEASEADEAVVPDDDPLMLAITGASAPAGLRQDPGAVERYEAALADVSLLRTQLARIADGGALPAESGSSTGEVAVPSGKRPRRKLMLGLAAVTAAAALLGGLGLARSAAGGGHTAKLTTTGIVSCARVIAEGTVRQVEPSEDGGLRVVLDVELYLKPQGGERTLSYTLGDGDGGVPAVGARVLVSISRFRDEPVQQYTGEDAASARQWMQEALPGSASVPCEGRG